MSSTYYNMTDSTGASGFLPTVVFDGSSTGFFTSAHRINQLSSIGITGFYEADFSNTVTTIDLSAFAFDTKVVVATINGVTSIRSDAFYGCTNMRSITLDSSANTSRIYLLTDISSGAFQGCTSLINLHIPDTVKTISDNLCNGCTSLELAVMGYGRDRTTDTYNRTATIGSRAFANCSKLSYFVVPETVRGINDSAFANDVSLALVSILGRPDISANAFTSAMGTGATYYYDNSASYTTLTAVTSSALFPTLATKRPYMEIDISGAAALTSTHVNARLAANSVTSYWKGKILNTVTSLGNNCFRGQTAGASGIGTTNYSNMIGLSFPNALTSIGSNAFHNSDGTSPVACNVGAFYIPSGVTSLGTDALSLTNATGQTLSSTKQFVCQSGTTGLPTLVSQLFQYTSAMAIVMPTVQNLAASCFEFARYIQYFNFFQKNAYTILTKLDGATADTASNAFNNCFNALTSRTHYLYIPKTVRTISTSAILNSTNPLLITAYTNSVDGPTTNLGLYSTANYFHSMFFSGTGTLTFHLICNYYTNSGLTLGSLATPTGTNLHVLFPSGVRAINNLFANKTILRTITIHETVTDISTNAFSDCSGLVNVYMTPNSNLTIVRDGAFARDVSLTSFFVPNSLRGIGKGTFSGCTDLASVTYGNNPGIEYIDVSGFANATNKLTSIFIPSSVVSIGSQAFSNSTTQNNLTTVTFGAGSRLKTIGGGCFGSNTATNAARYLTNLALPNGVRFMGAGGLGATAIDASSANVFRNAFTLTYSNNLILPSSLQSLSNSFLFNDAGVVDISNVYLPKSITNVAGPRNHCGYTTSGLGGSEFSTSFGSRTGSKLYLPSELSTYVQTSLPGLNRARSYYKTVSYTTNPLVTLGLGASVATTTDPITTTQIHADITEGVTVIGNGTTSIRMNGAVDGCLNLISVNIPSTVTDISANAFNGCRELAYVTFSENSKLTTIRESAFSGCTKISDITLPDTVTTIGLNAFAGCNNLARISIPYNVTSIAPNAFGLNRDLTKLGGDIDGEDANYQSGGSVSTNGDGTIVAIGTFTNNINGQVRVYKYQTITDATWTNYNATDFSYNGISPFNKPIVVADGDTNPVANKKYWVQMGGDIDGETLNDYAGSYISLSDDGLTVAIGAQQNDGSGNAFFNCGHVRVYKYDVTKTTSVTDQTSTDYGPVGWRRLGNDIDGEAASDAAGISVSLSADGTTVAIGAYSNNGTPVLSGRGQVRIYKYQTIDDLNWNNYNATSFTYTGTSPFNKPIVAAGGDANPVPGRNYWVQMGADIQGEAANDVTGQSVSISSNGTIVAIGARDNDAGGVSTDNRGHVRVYQYKTIDDLNWNNYNATDFSYNGISPFNKPIVVAGGDATPQSGKSYWVLLGGDIDGENAGDTATYVSLSSNGTIVAIGANQNDGTPVGNNRGHVRVYKYDVTKITSVTDQSSANYGPIGWRRLGQDIDGEVGGDESGVSVSLSGDGTTVAIGAHSNTSSKGHVRVYKYDVNKLTNVTDQSSPDYGPIGWRRLGQDIDGEAASDNFGRSVSLSRDGTTVAIGARYNDAGNGIGDNRGSVRVYSLSAIPICLHEHLYNNQLISNNWSTYFPGISTSALTVIPALQLTNALNPSKLTISQINNMYIRYRQSQLTFCTTVTFLPADGNLRASDITTALSGTIGLVHLVLHPLTISIAANACLNNKRIYSIAIPIRVNSIGDNAFNGCTNLTYVSFHPDNSLLTTIGSFAFGNASAVSNNIFDLALPDSLTTIGAGAFQNSANLTSVCIPNKVTSIGTSSFSSCPKLTSVALPDTLSAATSSYFNTNGSSIVGITFTTYSTNSAIPHFKLSDYSMPNGIVQNVVGSAVTYIDHLAYAYYPDITLYAVTTNKRTQTTGPYTYNVNNVQTSVTPAMHLLTALTYGVNTMFPIYRSIPDLNVFSESTTAANWADNTDDYYILMPGYSMCIYNNLYDEENIYINAPTFRYYDNEFGLNPLNITVPAIIANTTSSILIMYKGRILSKYFAT